MLTVHFNSRCMYALRNTLPILFPILVLTLPGCTLLQPYKSDSLIPSMPAQWSAGNQAQRPVKLSWLETFADEDLSVLVENAVGQNFDLRAAATRIEAARANASINSADRWPQIAASFNAQRSKTNTSNTSVNLSGISNSFQTGIDISWEADVWNRLGHQARAAVLEFEASKTDYQAAQFSLVANITRQWFNQIEAKQQVNLAQETVENFRQALTIIRENYQAGLNTALDVRLSRTNVATAESQLAARLVQLDTVQRSLKVLAGEYPTAANHLAKELPDPGAAVPAGLPSELLLRRPDLLAAEQRLLAAEERVSQAKKNRLPSIQLSGFGGTSSSELNDLLNSDNLIWNIAAGIAAPLFQGGRLKASQELGIANADQAAYQYSQAALNAFREVETALATAPLLLQQQTALETAVAEARESERLAAEQYRAGLVDIITWLDAQRQLFTARSNLLQIKNQRLQNRVDLFLALGGNFQTEETSKTDAL